MTAEGPTPTDFAICALCPRPYREHLASTHAFRPVAITDPPPTWLNPLQRVTFDAIQARVTAEILEAPAETMAQRIRADQDAPWHEARRDAAVFGNGWIRIRLNPLEGFIVERVDPLRVVLHDEPKPHLEGSAIRRSLLTLIRELEDERESERNGAAGDYSEAMTFAIEKLFAYLGPDAPSSTPESHERWVGGRLIDASVSGMICVHGRAVKGDDCRECYTHPERIRLLEETLTGRDQVERITDLVEAYAGAVDTKVADVLADIDEQMGRVAPYVHDEASAEAESLTTFGHLPELGLGPVRVDPSVAPGWIELRHPDGRVVGKIGPIR